MSTTTATPVAQAREIDEAIAALWTQQEAKRQRLAMYAHQTLQQAGANFYYRGKQRVTDMPLAEAEAILAADVAARASTADPAGPNHDHGYGLVRGGTSIGGIRSTVAGLAQVRADLAALRTQIETLEESYTGWSRFFLVTSSTGHIHSSMHCSTCRITTTFGWLPAMSGRTEADCVAEHGPALCSVCFPSAPVEWTAVKLTKSQAEKAAA